MIFYQFFQESSDCDLDALIGELCELGNDIGGSYFQELVSGPNQVNFCKNFLRDIEKCSSNPI